MTEIVGHVTSLHRYPVKSMGGERLEEGPLTLQGVLGDRRYAFVQAESKSPFPWLTGRETADILSYSAAMTADGKGVDVTTPGGARLAADSDELLAALAALASRPLNRLADHRGSYDMAPVTLMANATAKVIAEASETPVDPLRFRMNLYIDTSDDTGFVENGWVGKVLRIGETARVVVTERDRRCVMITLDHGSGGGESAAVLRAAAELNEANAGVYGAVTTAGTVREGDSVTVE